MTLLDPHAPELPPRPTLPDDADRRHWYAVRVAPNTEEKVSKRLLLAGVGTFSPSHRFWRNRRRGGTVARWRHIERPLLVGYVLVGIGRPTDWVHVLSADEVQYVVSGGDDEPLRIPTGDVLALAVRVAGGEFDEDKRPRRRRNPHRRGDRVRVSMAGLEDVEAVVMKAAGEAVFVELVESGLRAKVRLEAVR